jgi:hypothetical protein
MHQVSAILSAIGTAITIAMVILAAIIWAALLYFGRNDKADQIARAVKEKEQLLIDQEREARREEARATFEAKAFHEKEIQQARLERQKREEMRQIVSDAVAAQLKIHEEKIRRTIQEEITAQHPVQR